MDNELLHSEEYFGERRDFWWNRDYVNLLAQRLQLGTYRNVLDVGCGVGHWFRVLAPFLNEQANYTGIDREETWVEKSEVLNQNFNNLKTHKYLKGDAEKLPFDDETFDFVTCQTVLIHLNDPLKGLAEMLRVLKPGGLLLAAEPNNFANAAMFDSLTDSSNVDDLVLRLRDQLVIQNGKKNLGEGFNSLGEYVPGYMNQVGFIDINVSIADKTAGMIPPYSKPEEQAYIKELTECVETDFMGWRREDLERYFVAGGGTAKDAERFFKQCLGDQKEILDSIKKGTYSSAGGVVQYLISGYKSK